jgi:hypothetical protein
MPIKASPVAIRYFSDFPREALRGDERTTGSGKVKPALECLKVGLATAWDFRPAFVAS